MGRRARMRKLLREEDLEELLEQAEAEPEQAAPKNTQQAAPVDKALELQKSAGNRAVGAALDRWALPWVAQSPVGRWPKAAQMILDGEMIPIESVGEATGRSALGSAGAGSSSSQRTTGEGEMVVTLKLGKWSPDLFKANVKGKRFETVELVLPGKDGKGVRWILTDVLISGLQYGEGRGDDPIESLTLSFKKREFAQTPPPPRR